QNDIGSRQFFRWTPEYVGEVYNFVVDNHMALFLEKSLHGASPFKMMLACQQALTVYHPMCRYVSGAGVHGPAHHPGTHFSPKIVRNSAIAGYSSFWHQPHDVIHVIKKSIIGFFLTGHSVSI